MDNTKGAMRSHGCMACTVGFGSAKISNYVVVVVVLTGDNVELVVTKSGTLGMEKVAMYV